MFRPDINKSILSDKVFRSYSCKLLVISFVYSTFHFRNVRTSYAFPAFCLRKVSTLTSKQLFVKPTLNDSVLLDTAET